MKNVTCVPYVKLLRVLITQYNRAPIYVPYLLTFTEQLDDFIRKHGDVESSIDLPFTIHEVYDRLQDRNVPQIPTNLTPSHDPTPSPPQPSLTTTSDGEVVASLELNNDSIENTEEWLFDDITPTSNALQRLAKQRCPCCLIGVHPPEPCYFCEQDFIPTALKQRIALYNKVHGTKPPPGSKIKEWRPKSIPAIYGRSKQKTICFAQDGRKQFKLSNPFRNTA